MKEVNKKYLIIGIVTTLILCIGVSVAYFTGIIRGEGKNISVTSKKLEIIFTDTETITASSIEPGWETTKTFSVENKTGKEYRYDISIKDLENTFFLPYLEYEITSTNGYNTNWYREIPKNIGTLGRNISIANGVTHTYTIKFRYRNEENIDQNIDQGKSFSGKLQITETPSIIKQILADNPVVLERTSFDDVLGTETATDNTIYKASGNYTEDGSEVYYFAGNVSNNWVKFGKDEDNNDLYWRIIRTNEDGSVRLLYAGTNPSGLEWYIGESAYNNEEYNATGVGYMYGATGSLENNRLNTADSTIKKVVDTWYSNGINIKTDTNGRTYDSYVSKTAIYCNDRSSGEYSSNGYMNYAASNRIYHNDTAGRKPTYRCGYNSVGGYINTTVTWVDLSEGLYSNASIKDKFTVSTTTGNGDLTYPVALITADELAMAGGKLNTSNPSAYYFLNSSGESVTEYIQYWTMSPYNNDIIDSIMFSYVSSTKNNSILSDLKYSSGKVRPVISLKSCATISSGNGIITDTINTPYEVSIDSACASLEN